MESFTAVSSAGVRWFSTVALHLRQRRSVYETIDDATSGNRTSTASLTGPLRRLQARNHTPLPHPGDGAFPQGHGGRGREAVTVLMQTVEGERRIKAQHSG